MKDFIQKPQRYGLLAIIISIVIFIYAYYTDQIMGYFGAFLFILLTFIIEILIVGGKEVLHPEIEINIYYNKKFCAYNIEERFTIELINKGNGIANNLIGKILYYKNGKFVGTFPLDNISEIGAIAPTFSEKYIFPFDYEISDFNGIYIYIIYENPDKKGFRYCSSKYFYFKPSASKLKEIELRRENKIIFIKELFETRIVPNKTFALIKKWKIKSFFG